jgi:hypothetical protein
VKATVVQLGRISGMRVFDTCGIRGSEECKPCGAQRASSRQPIAINSWAPVLRDLGANQLRNLIGGPALCPLHRQTLPKPSEMIHDWYVLHNGSFVFAAVGHACRLSL